MIVQRLAVAGMPAIEKVTMAMRGAYGGLRYRDEPRTQTSPDVDRWFAETIPDGADAVFCAGRVSNRWPRAER
ncbi:hypothetical protein [Bradyrhizobium acaciae]|uniref:hypothetical protein n=1 Tax=Bradyrhizobium acaciae TaxID=2683706 RepID=UPI001E567A15|nr:hypothetical protein [Bradyrhizobium acaciae]MCC8983713.1 hypothetical protein [Bradyrhizobium acaciae]